MSNPVFFVFAGLCLVFMAALILLLSSLHQRGVQLSTKRQFSLRALLMALTGVAVVLGSILYAARK